MTDIDFDELDRAVNSLMKPKQANSSGEAPNNRAADSAQPTVPSPSTDTQTSMPNSNPAATAPSENDQPSGQDARQSPDDASSRPKVVVKPRGQFMDVIHNSSNMKSPNTTAPKLTPRHRSGGTLQPTSGVTPKDSANTLAEVKPKAQLSSEPAVQSQVQEAEQSWPDPIEMNQSSAQASADKSQDGGPLSTPFLADAKVDKRPLGGLQPTTELIAKPMADPEVSDVRADDTEQQSTLPDELKQDVLAVEAASNTESDSVSIEPAVKSAPAVNATSKTPATATVGSLPQSPPPQRVNSVQNEPDNSIFDTEQYQAPVKQPAKRKSNWLIVVAIVALVLLGTGGGIAFYLLSSGY